MKTIHLGGRLESTADQLVRLEAAINYTFIYFKNGDKKLVATTLGKIESRLPKKDFFRVNRSTVVNLTEVKIADDASSVKVTRGITLYTSRRKKPYLLEYLAQQKL